MIPAQAIHSPTGAQCHRVWIQQADLIASKRVLDTVCNNQDQGPHPEGPVRRSKRWDRRQSGRQVYSVGPTGPSRRQG